MSRITDAFCNKKAFTAFVTGGDPDIETTENIITALQEAGTDLIELGIPFSDPIAEGPVIQASSERALLAGTTTDALFDMVRRLRGRENGKVTIPIVFLTYMNPVFVYGKDRFFQRCADCGIDGLIIPDLPFEERDEVLEYCDRYGVELIYMISPSSDARIGTIAGEAKGFIYCVSSLGVTGVRDKISTDIAAMVKKAKAASETNTPCAVGFGISTPEQARDMAEVSDGVIVGSAIVRIIGKYGKDCVPYVKEYVRTITEELQKF